MADHTAADTPMSEKKDPAAVIELHRHDGSSSSASHGNAHASASAGDTGVGTLHVLANNGVVVAKEVRPSIIESVLGKTLARYYSTTYFQVFLVGVVAFACPGQFNALSGMGGGGQVEKGPSDKANITLYALFAFVSFFAGSIHNKLGSRLTLWLGSLGYVVYISSFLSYNFNKNQGFIIFSGALLGVCASLFWSAQGAMMMCYPTEAQKGRFIAIFWVVFNLGACIGSAVAMALSWDAAHDSSLGNGAYAAFIAITFFGGCCAGLLKNPASLKRSDGSPVTVTKATTWRIEITGLYKLLRTDPWVMLLFPMFFASNFFNTWQTQDYNGTLFTLRTRALNSLLYWLAQMLGAGFVSLICDSKLRRKTRAWICWSATFAIVFAVWGGCYAKQRTYSRENVPPLMDFSVGRAFVGPCFLYLFSGFMDSVWQCFTYWLMGSASNDLATLACFAGFYKCLQSAGAAVAFGIDLNKEPFMTLLGVTWALCGVGLVFAIPVIAYRVTEKTSDGIEKEDVVEKGSPESQKHLAA